MFTNKKEAQKNYEINKLEGEERNQEMKQEAKEAVYLTLTANTKGDRKFWKTSINFE